jgi:spore germination cell wall hydrolase CwlJ-like protein
MTLRGYNVWAALPFLSLAIAGAPVALAAVPAADGPKLPTPAPATSEIIQPQSAIYVAPSPADDAPPIATSQSDAITPEASGPDRQQVECVAKVIIHEAGGESRRGQIAVAQVIRSRVKDGRFGADPCSVIRQRGQFFDVDAYNPSHNDQRWSDAVEIATATLTTDGDEVAPGALFFHAARSSMPNRVRVAQIGGHVFYR